MSFDFGNIRWIDIDSNNVGIAMKYQMIDDPLVEDKLSELEKQDHVLGFLLQGSRVTGFGNPKSDYDIIVYCTNEFFSSLTSETMFDNIYVKEEGKKRLVGDISYFSEAVLEQQKTSPMDIDHIAYSESIVLMDKTGKLKTHLRELSKVDEEEFYVRLKMQMVQLAVAFGYCNINKQRERDLDVKVNLMRFVTIAITVWFTLNNSWTPQLKWWSSYVRKLGMNDQTFNLYKACLNEPNFENIETLYNHIKELVKEKGIELNLMNEFVATITPEGRKNYIRHSYF